MIDLPSRLIDPAERNGVIRSRCPVSSHGKGRGDSHRSLQVRRGERGWLVKCWASCGLDEICEALGIRPADLFYESALDPRQAAQAARLRAQQRREREQHREVEGYTLDACKIAQQFIESRRNIDITAWSDEQLDFELNALSDAYVLLESEGL